MTVSTFENKLILPCVAANGTLNDIALRYEGDSISNQTVEFLIDLHGQFLQVTVTPSLDTVKSLCVSVYSLISYVKYSQLSDIYAGVSSKLKYREVILYLWSKGKAGKAIHKNYPPAS